MGVRLEREGPLAVITLDWPETRNALTVDRISEVAAAIDSASGSGAHCLIVTGNGAFCAGADLTTVVTRQRLSRSQREAEIRAVAQSMVRALVRCPVPTIAAVDGPALGLGLDLALACDSILIGPGGWLMQAWGRVGVIPGTGGELLLRLRNPRVLWRWLATQERVTGTDAERWGIGEAVSDTSARDAALGRARSLSALPIEALRAYVELNRAELRDELPAHLDLCATMQARLLADSDLGERVARVLPKPGGHG
jgi:enoyl-CoA hydratase/carnithine racemase